MAISKLPDPPRRSDAPADFTTKADAFLAALPTFGTEANALQTDVNTKAAQVSTNASTASTAATNAATSETNAKSYRDSAQTAAAAAQSSAGLPSLSGNSGKVLKVNSAANGVQWGTVDISKYFESTQQTLTAGGILTISHGLGANPKLISAVLVCKTASSGYAVGDRVEISTSAGAYLMGSSSQPRFTGLSVSSNTTILKVLIANNIILPPASGIVDQSSTALPTATLTDWALIVRAAA
ncbi:hypothetical protein VPH49_10910 [Pseudomonas luteola]|uniref:hypothetical protein n=1 Tax=Pseudomonas luteola TaxID=47886 RepID=UPI003A89725E